jgi:hypothetical protein
MSTYRTVRIWRKPWWDRDEDEPTVTCGNVSHWEETWFIDCDHTPEVWDYTESARALCDETGADRDVLDVISSVYFTAWSLHRRRGVDHVNQWPLALVVLAGLREAGYEVVKRD